MPMYSACGSRRITGAGFPHSGIPGSKAVQRLTGAYRSRPRPSSTPGAKASTVCPYYLDGDRDPSEDGPGDTRCLANCAVLKVRRGDATGRTSRPVSQNSAACARPFPKRDALRPGPVDIREHSGAKWPPSVAPAEPELPRKEVIQPHLPVRLPCYDFTPITSPTFDGSLPRRGWVTGFGCCLLSWCDGRCVQDPGTYSPRRC